MGLVKGLYLLLLLTLPSGQLTRISLLPNVVVYLNDLLIPLVFFAWFIYSLGGRRKIYVPPKTALILLFVLIALLSLLIGSRLLTLNQSIVSGLFLLRFLEYWALYFIGYDLFTHDKKAGLQAVKVMIFSTFVVAVLGFFQFVLIPDFTRFAIEGGWDPHQYRVLSTFFDPNFVGVFFVIGLNVILAVIFAYRDKTNTIVSQIQAKDIVPLVLFGVAILLALVLTLSRSSYLALAVSIGLFGMLKSRKLVLGFLLVALLSVAAVPRIQDRFLAVFDTQDSASLRVVSWSNALTIIRDNPVLGVGYNSYRYAQDRYGFFTEGDSGGHAGSGADSSLLLILATTGVVGLTSFLAVWGSLSYVAWKNRHLPISMAFLISSVALLFHSQFVNSLLFPQILEIFWLVAALMMAEIYHAKGSKRA